MSPAKAITKVRRDTNMVISVGPYHGMVHRTRNTCTSLRWRTLDLRDGFHRSGSLAFCQTHTRIYLSLLFPRERRTPVAPLPRKETAYLQPRTFDHAPRDGRSLRS
jgi:hypothetical protein